MRLPGIRRPAGPRAGEINLARRPFVNERPVRRTALLLALAGLALLAVNLWLYFGYALERRHNEGELRQIVAGIDREQQRVTALRRTLAQADLGQQNALVSFLNERIAERTFGWSVLFDRLAGLLPADAHLISLSPQFAREDDRRRAGEEPGPVEVALAVQGSARDAGAVLELIDALFADPAFRDPDLHQESGLGGEVKFTLDVVYLPEVAEALASATAEATVAAAADGVGAAAPAAAAEVAP
jgi:Tfp pilus assembly protein PilN